MVSFIYGFASKFWPSFHLELIMLFIRGYPVDHIAFSFFGQGEEAGEQIETNS
jgi:hypothetical protein